MAERRRGQTPLLTGMAITCVGVLVIGCSSGSATTSSPNPAEASSVMNPVRINGAETYGFMTGCDQFGNRIYRYSAGPGNPTIAVVGADPTCRAES